MKTLLLLLALTSVAQARENLTLDYYGNVVTPTQARRNEVKHFYCLVQMELASKQIMHGRWVENHRCW